MAARIHRAIRLVQRAADVGAGNRNCFIIHVHQRFLKRIRVKRERALDEGAAGERDEAHATVTLPADKIQHREFRALHPARQNIAGQHAARTVEDKHDIFADKGIAVGYDAPLRSRERKAGQRDSCEQQNIFELPPGRAVGGGERHEERWRGQPC